MGRKVERNWEEQRQEKLQSGCEKISIFKRRKTIKKLEYQLPLIIAIWSKPPLHALGSLWQRPH